MMQMLGGAGLDPSRLARVAALILATKHSQPPVGGDEQLLVDIDLSILGRPSEEFDAYERAIRMEYQHVAAESFRAGRAAVLRKFVERLRIYCTGLFYERYESTARQNLQRSIVRLTEPQ